MLKGKTTEADNGNPGTSTKIFRNENTLVGARGACKARGSTACVPTGAKKELPPSACPLELSECIWNAPAILSVSQLFDGTGSQGHPLHWVVSFIHWFPPWLLNPTFLQRI